MAEKKLEKAIKNAKCDLYNPEDYPVMAGTEKIEHELKLIRKELHTLNEILKRK